MLSFCSLFHHRLQACQAGESVGGHLAHQSRQRVLIEAVHLAPDAVDAGLAGRCCCDDRKRQDKMGEAVAYRSR
jgi:hypothetical protein